MVLTTETEEIYTMKIKTLSILIISAVVIAVITYTGVLLWLTWPISEFSLDRSGLYGDSFGMLTSLFSGLAFSGMLIAVLLQREELQLQRKEIKKNHIEFKKGVKAQRVNVKLGALNVLLIECKEQIRSNESRAEISYLASSSAMTLEQYIKNRNRKLNNKKESIIFEIEKILKKSGVLFE